MKSRIQQWTSVLLIFALVMSLLPPIAANAAGAVITITYPLPVDDLDGDGKPAADEDRNIVRLTNSNATITATIQNVSADLIPSIYYEITNMTTGNTTVEKSNRAIWDPSQPFNISFQNVSLTEGLNKIVIKMGETSVVSSEPGWAYFTPTTNIKNLTINDEIFVDNKIYPDDPDFSTALEISGSSPNASEVLAYLYGDTTPKNAYFSGGEFFFIADDINKTNSTANFRLRPGDNLLTIIAKNATKNFEIDRNIIYDNGGPFAFGATIQGLVKNETVDIDGNGDGSGDLYLDANLTSLEVHTQPNGQGELIDSESYDVVDADDDGKYEIVFDGAETTTDLAVTSSKVYLTYTVGDPEKLILSPTITTPYAKISSLLKVDVNALNDPEYRYVKIKLPGKEFGPYDLGGAVDAPWADEMNPMELYEGYLPTLFSIQGSAIDNNITVSYESADADAAHSGNLTYVRSNSDETVGLFELEETTLSSDKSPYTFTVKNGSTILDTFQVQVYDNGNMPSFDYDSVDGADADAVADGLEFDLAELDLKENDYEDETVTITFSETVDYRDLDIDILNLAGDRVIASAVGESDTNNNDAILQFTVPNGLNEGQYKIRVSYDNVPLTERYFEVGAEPQELPEVTGVVSPTIPKVNGPLYIAVEGSNFGNDVSKFSAVTFTHATQPDVSATVFDVRDDQLVLYVNDADGDADDFVAGETYNIEFTFTKNDTNTVQYDNDGINNASTTVDVVALTDTMYFSTINDGEVLQYTEEDIEDDVTFELTGVNVVEDDLRIDIVDQDGDEEDEADFTVDTNTVTVEVPDDLDPGYYYVRVMNIGNADDEMLTEIPLNIIAPGISSIERVYNETAEAYEFVITGSNFGLNLDDNELGLKFESLDNDSAAPVEITAEQILGGERAVLEYPVLNEGSYLVTLMYGDAEFNSINYNVTSTTAELEESFEWSKEDQYKVYEFTTELAIPSDRTQLTQFEFYNFSSDDVPPTEFTFHYVNPNLPYVDHVKRDGFLLNEAVTNEINELPSTLRIYADSNTKKVNVYLGNYTSNSPIYKSLVNPQNDPQHDLDYFEMELDGIPNGDKAITFIPSTVGDTNGGTYTEAEWNKSGENLAGMKAYDLSFTSTPYVILHNIFNGLQVDDENKIQCTKNGDLEGKCISGRLVNVPQSDYDIVRMYINDDYVTLDNDDFTNLEEGEFKIVLGDKGIDFADRDGKNTIKFEIYITENGTERLVTTATYEIFIFSDEVSEFLSLKPIETGDEIKYIPAQNPDTYVTTEPSVAFSGQFSNASEIKLVVRRTNKDGQSEVIYDRRYNNFRNEDPDRSNPGFFDGRPDSNGNFETNEITLSPIGDTFFEFSITNDSKQTVTRTIGVSREPLPYEIIYPKLIKNPEGEFQANINSNYIEIELAAENADRVLFDKDAAIAREVEDEDGNKVIHYFYEVRDLKAGKKEEIEFTVVRGQEELEGSFYLFNIGTPIEGAQFKTEMDSKIDAFDKRLNLVFPKNTYLMRNEPGSVNQYLTADRDILFGIASSDGRVDKFKHPAASDGQLDNPNRLVSSNAKLLLQEPTGRFRPASPLYWIDAGVISENTEDQAQALNGSGTLPYDQGVEFYNRSLEDLVVPTNNGTLTIQYDPVIRQDAWKYVTVYHYDIYEDHRGIVQPRWRNLGGVVDSKKNTITVPVERFGYYQVMYMDQSFDDVIGHSWARHDLDTLYSKGIMMPKSPPTNFVPNDPISRGEFTTMLVKIFEIPLEYDDDPTFTDVLRVNPLTNGLYDYKYIETAARAGIVRGGSGGRFMPDNSITRQDAAVIIARAANLKLNTSDTKTLASLQKSFTDANNIEPYARASVEAISKADLITGKENLLLQGQSKPTFRFDPAATFTRAEAAAVMIRIMKQQKKIPK